MTTFPRTFNINELFNVSNSESKEITQSAEFNEAQHNTVTLNDSGYSNIVKNIIIEVKSHSEIKSIEMFINDNKTTSNNLIIESVKSDDGNRECFRFKIFNVNGVVLNPKLFSIKFKCNTVVQTKIEIKYTGIAVDEQMLDFLKYNQYYGVHLLDKLVLAIYYCPYQIPAYNVKFIDSADLVKFNDVIKLDYNWQCPVIRTLSKKNPIKEKHRIISVEVTPEIEKALNDDPLLKYESVRVELDGKLINKSYIICVNERKDVESHLLSEYGLISYITISKLPITDIDEILMEKIHNSQLNVLKRLIHF